MSDPSPQVAAVNPSTGEAEGGTRRTGQVPHGRLAIRRGLPLREGLLGAFRTILAATGRIAGAASADPVEAVHEFRKSIRRARATVELLRPALGKRAADGVVLGLKKAFAETGTLRDTDILLAALASLGEPDSTTESLATELRAELARRPGPARTSEVLLNAVSGLRLLPKVLEVILPADYSIRDLHKGLVRTQRRARKALSQALTSDDQDDFHRWRRRVKDLRYQVELLASTGSQPLRRREKQLARLAQEVGSVTDLFVLGREVESRAALLPDAPRLAQRIREASQAAAKKLLSRGDELLAEPPRQFADRVLAERG